MKIAESIEEIAANPHLYGAPTLAEFTKNPDVYRLGTKNGLMEMLDGSMLNFRKDLRKQYYILDGYTVGSLEKLDNMARNMGIDLTQYKVRPELRKYLGDQFDLYVHFDPPPVQVYRDVGIDATKPRTIAECN